MLRAEGLRVTSISLAKCCKMVSIVSLDLTKDGPPFYYGEAQHSLQHLLQAAPGHIASTDLLDAYADGL